MTSKPIYVKDIIGEAVTYLPDMIPDFLPSGDRQGRVKKTLLQIIQDSHPEAEGIHYLYGPGAEISETLAQKDKAQTMITKRYPLIALFFDFEETISNQLGVYVTSPLRIAIVNHTEISLKTYERYERNFQPVLYPIYQCFISALEQSGKLIWNNGIVEHRKIDKPYYDASEAANAGNDFLDAIEIRDLSLKIYTQNC